MGAYNSCHIKSGNEKPYLSLNPLSSSLAEMWYGVFLWALVSSLSFHVPAGLLALFTLRHHKYGAAIAGVYRAAGKKMIPFEALILGVGQTFCVVVVSFLRILATL
ncbi:transmembrane protein 170A isoform X2 [Alligator sinensis]|uniref:Transmembrane protein 170A n=1 Tax=Alligator sinensis TaxID=38654 RepID=A0A1U8D9F1_ALLSI|nr:transmembrane protein 170A isoform X2 [Alligator sinensis]